MRAVGADSPVLCGFDADLTIEGTRAINRLRSLLLQIFPSLERVSVGTILTRGLMLDLLITHAGLTSLRPAGVATSCAVQETAAARIRPNSSMKSSPPSGNERLPRSAPTRWN